MSKIDKNGNIDISSANPHIKEGAKNGTFKETKKSFSNNNASLFVFILLFLCVIAIANFLRTGNHSDVTFRGLLDFLANAPDFNLSWGFIDLTIYGDWGIVDFLRIFINSLSSILEIFLIFCNMITESLQFLFYLVKGLFFA